MKADLLYRLKRLRKIDRAIRAGCHSTSEIALMVQTTERTVRREARILEYGFGAPVARCRVWNRTEWTYRVDWRFPIEFRE